MKKTSLTLTLAGIGLLWISCLTARSAVVLELVNPNDLSNNALSVAANSTFSLAVYVQGLTTPALNNFNISLAALPSGFALSSFTDTIPSGWLAFPNVSNQVYGGFNWSGQDITGDAVLFRINLVAGNTSGIVDFIAQGALQNLLDAQSSNIAFQQHGIQINVVPEPNGASLLGCLGIILIAFRLLKLKERRIECTA